MSRVALHEESHMLFNTWYNAWHKGREEKRGKQEEKARQKQAEEAKAGRLFVEARCKAYADAMEHVRKAIEKAIADRKRFLDVKSFGGSPDLLLTPAELFRSAVIAVANEEESWVLDVNFSADGGRALLKLAMAPKGE